MQVTRKSKVFADEAGKLVYRVGPGDYDFVDLAQLQGSNMLALVAKVGGIEALAEVVTAAKVIAAMVETGTTSPSSTPAAVGLWYIDTTGAQLYFSKGISSSADWVDTTS
jgi:L-alanine-DL-glutamate epimerase-like enolase superfamily enzyme